VFGLFHRNVEIPAERQSLNSFSSSDASASVSSMNSVAVLHARVELPGLDLLLDGRAADRQRDQLQALVLNRHVTDSFLR
jgi:hypothetical protein